MPHGSFTAVAQFAPAIIGAWIGGRLARVASSREELWQRAMIDADVSRSKRAEKVDALAAAHILQGAIDALANLPRHD